MKKKSLIIFSCIAVLAFGLGFSNVAQAADCVAQTCQPGTICLPNPLKVCTIEELIDNIINFIFFISLAIAPLMIIIAAVYLLISAGDPGKVNKAKDIILYTAIGLLIVLLARGLIAIIKQVLT